MKMKVTIWGLLMFNILLFSSCQTKEERVINKFESLAERVNKNSETFSDKDWEGVLAEYEAIHKEAKECEFSDEQLREFGRVEGLLSGVMAIEGSKKLGRDLGKYVNKGKQVVEGFFEGISESSK